MENLPDELLLQILDLLSDSDLIDVVPFVSLRWSRMSVDSHIWRNRTYIVQRNSEAVKFFSRKPALRSVAFLDELDDAVVRSLALHCPTITSLEFHSAQRLSLHTLRLITRICDEIRELRVPSEVFNCPDRAREVALMPRLETLDIHGHHDLQLHILSAGFARLRHLKLHIDRDACIGDFGAPLLRRLQRLTTAWNSLSHDIVHCAESLEMLSLWHCRPCTRPDSALAEDLRSLKALTHVEARFLPAGPQVLRALMQPLLRSLNLWFCQILDDDLLLELCRRCPLLEDLDLSHCGIITTRGLSSMWSLRRLRRLDLNYCRTLGSGAMIHLARCDGLQELRMDCVDMYGMEPGVSQLLELKNLRVLVFRARSARHLIPWEMFPKSFPHLRTLELGWWMSQDTSIPENLKAAMPTVQVSWKSP